MRSVAGLLLVCAFATESAAQLPPGINVILDGHDIPPGDVSIVVHALDSPEPVLSHLPDVPRNPASVMKMVTTWSALEILGPAYTWETEIWFDGDFDGTTLDGDLVLKGFGDPFLVVEEIWKLFRVLRGLGLEDILGNIVLDDSYFEVLEEEAGRFDASPYRAYNVIPNALLTNFKAVRFRFFADPNNDRVRISTDPPLSNLDIRNRIDLVGGRCRGFQAGISFNVADPGSISRIIFEGEFPERCNSYELNRSVLQHDTYAFGLIDALWSELGGSIGGGLRNEVVSEDAELVLTWRSRPLGDVIRLVNKNSNNVMTRQLLYTMGAESFEPPGTRAKGVAAIDELLQERGIAADSVIVDNGAGLSRDARLSAAILVQLLQEAARGIYAPEFISSLALGGLDGTTRTRFEDGSGAGRMHLKTGSLDDVSALAGYVHVPNGKTYVMVVFVNTPDAHRGPGNELEDAVVEWIYTLQ